MTHVNPKHKYSTIALLFLIGLMILGSVISLTSDDLDLICSTDETMLYRLNGSWQCVEVSVPIVLSTYDAEPARGAESNVHGGIISLATNQPLNPTTNISISKGNGKLFIIINAGSDVTGSITFKGTSIDRNTGIKTNGDTCTISIDTLSTDNSANDGNGNNVHNFSNGYITCKWFTGQVEIYSNDVTLTDVDVYHVSFEQFNDADKIITKTFDVNLYTTNVNAEFDAYLYTLHVIGSKLYLHAHASLHIGNNGETAIANQYSRLRRGNLNEELNCTTDGIFVDVFYANSPAYVEDVSMKVWVDKIIT